MIFSRYAIAICAHTCDTRYAQSTYIIHACKHAVLVCSADENGGTRGKATTWFFSASPMGLR